MAAFVTSIEKFQLVLTNTDTEKSGTLTKGQTTANCVPFVTTRVTTPNGAAHAGLTVQMSFSGATVVAKTSTSSVRELVAEVTVVEFDPTYVKVQANNFSTTSSSYTPLEGTDYDGGTGFQDSTFLYHTWRTDSTTTNYSDHCLRGNIFGDTNVNFSRITGGGEVWCSYWLVQALTSEFTVQHIDIRLDNTQQTNTGTVSPSVDTAKSFVLGSRKSAQLSNDDNAESTFNTTLTSGSVVTINRSSDLDDLWCVAQVIEFNSGGNENVYRGTIDPTDGNDTDTISTAVTVADSMVHVAGATGGFTTGSFPGADATDCPDAHCALTITGPTEITCIHDTGGGEAGELSWEVIEWDTGAAPPATRRVMVIS